MNKKMFKKGEQLGITYSTVPTVNVQCTLPLSSLSRYVLNLSSMVNNYEK